MPLRCRRDWLPYGAWAPPSRCQRWLFYGAIVIWFLMALVSALALSGWWLCGWLTLVATAAYFIVMIECVASMTAVGEGFCCWRLRRDAPLSQYRGGGRLCYSRRFIHVSDFVAMNSRGRTVKSARPSGCRHSRRASQPFITWHTACDRSHSCTWAISRLSSLGYSSRSRLIGHLSGSVSVSHGLGSEHFMSPGASTAR